MRVSMALPSWLKRHSAAPAIRVERWVILDVETSGLNPQEAQLLAVAGVAVQVDWHTRRLVICPSDSLEVEIRPTRPVTDKNNILVHGIGHKRQQMGLPLGEALPQVLQFIAGSPLLAFHAWFDHIMITRHLQLASLAPLPNPWIDIEKLCVALEPTHRARSLDAWLDKYHITCTARHEAASDAFAECELLQCMWPRLAHDARNWKELKAIEQYGRSASISPHRPR